LDIVGLQEGTLPGTASQGSLDGLAVATAFGTVVPLFLAWYFTFKISMSEEKLQDIQAQLATRSDK
jgi:hypothetical protein